MKKLLRILMVVTCLLGVTGCQENGNSQQTSNDTITEIIQEEPLEEQNILIAYFTWADNTNVTDEDASVQSAAEHFSSMGDSAIDLVSSSSVIAPGNTARIASLIQEEVGGDLFSIQTEELYPSIYEDCLEVASNQKAENARPALASEVENFEQYDIIFLGFPNWWYTLPMPIHSFLESYDFTGKTVIPFCVHGTGGLSATIRDLRNALGDDVNLLDAFDISRTEILEAEPFVKEWLSQLGF